MLQVFFGSDQIKIRQEAHFAIGAIISPEKELIRLEADKYEAGQLLSVSSSASLFSPSAIYLVESPSALAIFWEEFISNVEALATSAHTFIVIEQELLAADKKKITKYAARVEEYKESAESAFSPFKMSDALAVKDKRSLWLLFQEAKQNGLSAEEIIGTLWWQLKSMRLAAITRNSDEAGMKEYPYKKAKSALNTFKLPEVEKNTRALLKLYHEGHRGKRDLDIALEEWILSL
jgi:DNA polymerase III delta subunit